MICASTLLDARCRFFSGACVFFYFNVLWRHLNFVRWRLCNIRCLECMALLGLIYLVLDSIGNTFVFSFRPDKNVFTVCSLGFHFHHAAQTL